MPDVAIIGAGPAGSVAAVALARRGWRVTLLEQHRFPRDKVCGECLSALGIDVLSRLGLAEVVCALGPVRLSTSMFIAPGGDVLCFDLPRPMWGLPRAVLDDRLMTAARAAGAAVLDLQRCERVDGGSAPQARVRDLRTNALRAVRADYILVADGKGALAVERPRGSGDFGLKAHFSGLDAPPDAVALLGVRGHYVGIAPVGGDAWNLAMSVPQSRLRACGGDGDRVIELVRRENRALGAMLRTATRTSAWIASPLPRFGVARHWPRGVIPVGNAAAALEPIGGEGMGLAMRSAELAAAALDDARRRAADLDVAALRRAYEALWTTRSRACRAAAWAISSPALADFAVQAASASDAIRRVGMNLVGK